MNSNIDPDKIRIPAFLRKKAIVRQAKQQLILTALDRKLAGLDVHSKKPLAPIVRKSSSFAEGRLRLGRTKNELKNESPTQVNMSLRSDQKTISIATGDHLLIVPIGTVIDYYEKIQVAIIRLKEALRIGDVIQIAAKNFLFQQPVDSMQINRKPVKMAKKSAEIGLKVLSQPQVNGTVYKVIPAENKKMAADRDKPSIAFKTFLQPLF